MDIRQCTDQYLVLTAVLVLLMGVTIQGYMAESCRRCMHTGDWAACAACYSSKRGIVPFYGMGKRSSAPSYVDIPESSDAYYYETSENAPIYEVHKRASHLVSYCCMRLGDDECCNTMGVTPYFGKRSSDDEYNLYTENECSYCLERDTFDFSYCLRCVRKK